MNKVKQLPYGVSDFEYVMRENYYYVDKTMYIPQIEDQPNNLMFIRPRRFGKSLLLSMLKTYYATAIATTIGVTSCMGANRLF